MITGQTCSGYSYGYDYGYGYGYGYDCNQTVTPPTTGGGGGGGGGGSTGGGTPGSGTPTSTPTGTPPTGTTGTPKPIEVKAKDIAKSIYKSAIETLIEKGFVKNTVKFAPQKPITRAEFVKILANAYGFDKKVARKKFKDVDYKSDLALYIDFGVAMGWINVRNDEFRPNDYITRGEAQKLLDVVLDRAVADTVAEPSATITRGLAAKLIVEALGLK